MFKFCDSPFNVVHIHANGDVSPCLCRGWHNFGVAGNLHKNTLSEIFNNSRMEEFRQTIQNQTFSHCVKNNCGKIWNLDLIENFDHIQQPKLPTIIYLQDLDYSCNLKCPSCRIGPIYSKSINPTSKYILDAIKQEYKIFDQPVLLTGDGQGEMLASSTYLDFLKSADLPQCIRLGINSNGNLLLKRIELLESLHRRGNLASMAVSFDAASSKTYKKIRGARFDLVTNGVKQLIDLGINVTTQMVVQYENYHEILQYRDLCLKLGVSFMGLQTIRRWKHMTNDWWRQNTIENNPNMDYDFLVQALKEFKKTPNTGIDGGLEKIIFPSANTIKLQIL